MVLDNKPKNQCKVKNTNYLHPTKPTNVSTYCLPYKYNLARSQSNDTGIVFLKVIRAPTRGFVLFARRMRRGFSVVRPIAASDPVPAAPAASDPVPAAPAASDPVPAAPAASDPVPAAPAASDPVPAAPAASDPVPAAPAASDPVPAAPAASDPVPAAPAASDPVPAAPAASDPVPISNNALSQANPGTCYDAVFCTN
uniref:Uncharacterized protein n=1 Tax=Astyanax mexicanus TaxID=7994 RepID=A0A3B1JPN7_ASTMX